MLCTYYYLFHNCMFYKYQDAPPESENITECRWYFQLRFGAVHAVAAFARQAGVQEQGPGCQGFANSPACRSCAAGSPYAACLPHATDSQMRRKQAASVRWNVTLARQHWDRRGLLPSLKTRANMQELPASGGHRLHTHTVIARKERFCKRNANVNRDAKAGIISNMVSVYMCPKPTWDAFIF